MRLRKKISKKALREISINEEFTEKKGNLQKSTEPQKITQKKTLEILKKNRKKSYF